VLTLEKISALFFEERGDEKEAEGKSPSGSPEKWHRAGPSGPFLA